MTLEELLDSINYYFDGELSPDNIDTYASFIWDSSSLILTDTGREHFKDILELPVELRGDVIHIYTNTNPENNVNLELDHKVNEFVNASAGFIPESEYYLFFQEK